ncbi:MAG: TonB-dependent receptor [Porphyrobacter sp.]|nr:TonB-dependent receptor [Porphyrobacter sp.]
MRLRLLPAACAVSLLPIVAHAQDAQEGTTAFDLGQIIVRAPAREEAVIGSETVNQEAIETFYRNTLDEAASLLPGVNASNSGGSRNERLLFVRGFDRFQVPLSIDGIRVYLPADNRLDYGRFLTPDLAEVQVAKGYASVLDGPGAMGGAVNLVTRKPTQAFEAEARASLDLDSDLGYAGYTTFALVGTRQDKWYAQASYTRNEQDHWDLPGSFVPTPSEDGGERDFSQTEDWRFNAKVAFTPNATDEYSISYTRQEGSKNAPLHVSDTVASQRNWSWPYWNIDSIYWLSTTAVTDQLTLKTRAYHNGFDNLLSAWDDATQTTQTRPRAFNSYYEDEAWGGSGELAYAFTDTDVLSFALHYRSDKHVEFQQSFPAGTTEPPQTNKEDTWSIAGEYTGALASALTLTIGASYDWRNLKRAEEYGTVPGGGSTPVLFDYPIRDANTYNVQGRLNWQASEATAFYASVSSRARFPTIFERFSSRFGGAVSNPDLDAERAVNYEVGASTDIGKVHAEGALFYSDISNAIVSFPFIYEGQAVSQSRNVGSAEYYGLELSLDARIADTLTAGANYTFIKRNFDDPSNAGFEPTGVPTHKGIIYVDWQPVDGLHVYPNLELASDRWTVNTAGTSYYRTGGYVLANFRVDYDVTDKVTLGAGVRNAFDELYYLTDGFPEPGRRFYLTARVRT